MLYGGSRSAMSGTFDGLYGNIFVNGIKKRHRLDTHKIIELFMKRDFTLTD